MLKMPSFSPQISIGNILSIGTVVVGLAIGWQALSSTVGEVERKVARLEIEADKLRDKVTLNELTTQKALTEIQSEMHYIHQSLDRLANHVAPSRSTP